MTTTVTQTSGATTAKIVFKKGPDPKPKKDDGYCNACWAMGTNPQYDPNANDLPDTGKLSTWQKVVLGAITVVAAAVILAPVAIVLAEGCLATAPVCAAEIAEMATGGASGGSMAVGGATVAAGTKVLTAGKSLPDGPVTLYGPFHRLSSPTQTADDARAIVESGELWGLTPKWGGNATAQAHRGPIPTNAKPGSLEFYTTVKPKPQGNTPPGYASWGADVEAGVRSFIKDGDDWASIPIIITEVR
ncbi:hypothetical protein ACIQAD_34420 [Streptomyces sp. NPDC088551]|uniref:hypothetical protein n=1 Tax=Streptomyces sp. NPDC088551 TaxID=3365863 RepID=UPI003801910C